MQQSNIEPVVICNELPAKAGRIGHLLLNRPQVLNALSTDVVELISNALTKWQQDPEILAVIIQGVGDRAFCAGGDLKQLYYAGVTKYEQALPFFKLEYQLNLLIHRFTKPYIALIHGITMGGGLGISVHGSHIVAAADLQLAMPESAIGFYPDVGGTYFLSHLPDYMGMYMGLTGNTISISDALFCGLVKYCVPRDNFDALIQELCNADLQTNLQQAINATIQKFATNVTTPSTMQQKLNTIKNCFAKNSVTAILTALQQDGSPWALQQLAVLQSRSPTSLMVIQHQLTIGANMDIAACMTLELNLTRAMIQRHDIYEGVRAALIDKTRDPHWSPADLAAISSLEIQKIFEIKCQL
jgi:enoyl-CoA hydratase